MKRNNKSKSRNSSPRHSQHIITQPSSVRGLITNRQQNMRNTESSQVSGHTQRTNKSTSTLTSNDFDYVDDQMYRQDMRDVFIDQEQEKAIYKILQVARKGKINQKNAFEIPLKVLDDQNFSVAQTKFWKFAAELLGASMNIYEKRIENTWMNTNLIHDKLARMEFGKDKKQENDQNQENQNKAQRSSFHMISIQDFRDPRNIQNVQVGQETLQDIHKINVTRIKRQFSEDPLFQKKLKAFDNTSLKGILLNVFDLSTECEIELFCTQNRIQAKHEAKIKKDDNKIGQFLANQISASSKILSQNIAFFGKVSSFKAANFPNEESNQNTLHQIDFTRFENQNKNYEPLFEETVDVPQEQQQTLQSQMPAFENFHDSVESQSFQPKTQPENFGGFMNQESQGNRSFYSQKQNSNNMMYGFEPLYSESSMNKSFHSVMTPWELQFKQGRLKKKLKRNNSKNKTSTKIKTKAMIEQSQILFDSQKIQSKNNILKMEKNSQNVLINKKVTNFQNLVPPQLAVYERVNYKKVSQTRVHYQYKEESLPEDIPQFLAPDPSMIQDFAQNSKSQTGTYNAITKQIFAIGQSQLRGRQSNCLVIAGMNEQKYLNIRQTKKQIYDRTKQERELRISELEMQNLNPASIFITFLHIANEKNMIVTNSAEQDDIILCWE